MGWRLSTYVHAVARDDAGQLTGQSATFGPGDALPDWAVAAISNPDVWAERGDSPDPEPEPKAPAAPVQPATGGPPPKGGAGSGAPEWRAYAARKDVEVPEDANRDQVIAALTEAGVPTE